MERSFSVDDLVGGLYRLGQAGMGRTDSEAAFQEFLKRIPSATNLAAAANASSAAAAAAAAAEAAPALPISTSGSFSGAAEAAPLSAGGGAGGRMPRVASLDLLAKLVMQGASAAPQTLPVKGEPGAADGACGLVALVHVAHVRRLTPVRSAKQRQLRPVGRRPSRRVRLEAAAAAAEPSLSLTMSPSHSPHPLL
jgi:hypothetical protein